MKTLNKTETIKNLLHTAGHYPFRVESCYPDSNAERNLQGRTHWLSPETRRYFKSRVLDSGMTADGLVFWLVESNRSKPFEADKNKRFVAFDVWGSVLTEGDEWHKTSAQALKAGRTWLASFDGLAHTENKLRETAKREIHNAAQVLEALS